MNEPIDMKRLIAETRAWTREDADGAPRNLRRLALVLADKLESTTAELARAQECIEEVRRIQMFRVGITAYGDEYMRNVHKTIADYEKGSSDV